MLVELPLTAIEENPYNSRIKYHQPAIERLVQSLRSNGQLSAVKVRECSKHKGCYELVFGHRRVMAARRLGWEKIRAEVVQASEEEMINQSLVENFEHEDLSDYEKALIFERMNKQFGKTYEEIGKTLGISKQHVSNYVGMLRLFSPELLASNPELLDSLQRVSEHHARVLSRVDDISTKCDLAKMISKEKLSVKELTNIVGRLRSWFTAEKRVKEQEEELWYSNEEGEKSDGNEIEEITKIVLDEFRLAHTGDFDSYKEMHLFGEGFSIYSAFPPFCRVEGEEALSKERKWFYKIAPKLAWKFRDLKINVLGETALATLTVAYSGRYFGDPLKMELRGTVVLTRKENSSWKILHEHWSRQDAQRKGVVRASHAIHSSALMSR